MCVSKSLFLYLPESSVCTVAVCAGSGASVLNGVRADLYITGEKSSFYTKQLYLPVITYLLPFDLLDIVMHAEVIATSFV